MHAPVTDTGTHTTAAVDSECGSSDQHYCLRWNNYQTNMTSGFNHLLQNDLFVDVTLVVSGTVIKAHRVILSACSPYFKSMLCDNPCEHPIIIIKDVALHDIQAVMSFMYCGEINVNVSRLPGLLKVAEALKIRGLAEVRGDGMDAEPMESDEMADGSEAPKDMDTENETVVSPPNLTIYDQSTSPESLETLVDLPEFINSPCSTQTPRSATPAASAYSGATPTSQLACDDTCDDSVEIIAATSAEACIETVEISPSEPSQGEDRNTDNQDIDKDVASPIIPSPFDTSKNSLASGESFQHRLQAAYQKCWNQQQGVLQNIRFRERGPLKSWRPETMADAILCVLKNGNSLSQAARMYDIPYPTFVLYANRVHNLLGPSANSSDLRPKGRGRPQRILLGNWPEQTIRNVISAVVFRDTKALKDQMGDKAAAAAVAGFHRSSKLQQNQQNQLNGRIHLPRAVQMSSPVASSPQLLAGTRIVNTEHLPMLMRLMRSSMIEQAVLSNLSGPNVDLPFGHQRAEDTLMAAKLQAANVLLPTAAADRSARHSADVTGNSSAQHSTAAVTSPDYVHTAAQLQRSQGDQVNSRPAAGTSSSSHTCHTSSHPRPVTINITSSETDCDNSDLSTVPTSGSLLPENSSLTITNGSQLVGSDEGLIDSADMAWKQTHDQQMLSSIATNMSNTQSARHPTAVDSHPEIDARAHIRQRNINSILQRLHMSLDHVTDTADVIETRDTVEDSSGQAESSIQHQALPVHQSMPTFPADFNAQNAWNSDRDELTRYPFESPQEDRSKRSRLEMHNDGYVAARHETLLHDDDAGLPTADYYSLADTQSKLSHDATLSGGDAPNYMPSSDITASFNISSALNTNPSH